MSEGPDLLIAADPQALAERAAETVLALAVSAVEDRGEFTIALSGGNTPRILFERLAGPPFSTAIEWSRWRIYFSDERFVPPESAESNYHTAREALLSRVPIGQDSVFRIPTVGISPEEAAAAYQSTIESCLGGDSADAPCFDLILLGLGPDGHTASLFPGTAALDVRDRLVAANHVPSLDAWRITFTYPLINAARNVAFLAEGEGKAERVGQVLDGTENLPAAGVQPADGRLIWLLDRAAASRLLT